MQNYNETIARRMLCIAGRLHRLSVGIDVFFDNHQSLKACIHGTKSICVDLNVRELSHKLMNTLPNLEL